MGHSVIDYATLTVSTTAVGLDSASPALPRSATGAIITSETDAVRWRADGTAPASDEGHVMAVNTKLEFLVGNWRDFLRNVKFIRVTSDAALKITYLRNF